MWKIYLTSLIISLAAFDAFSFQDAILDTSSSLNAKAWTIDDGLPVNSLNNMVQDSMGYLWMSTFDGLVKFDGLKFEVYNQFNVPEMPHNRISMVYLQDEVGLWLLMEYGGAVLKSNKRFIHFDENDGFSNSEVTSVLEHSSEGMLFGTNSGVYQYQNGEFSAYYISDNEFQNQINHLFEDSDGSVYVSTNDGLIHLKDGMVSNRYSISENQSENIFFTITRSTDNQLLIGSIFGLYEINAKGFAIPDEYDALRNIAIHSIYEEEGEQLLGTSEGLYRYRQSKLEKVVTSSESESSTFISIYRDSYNELWILGMWGKLLTFNDGYLKLFEHKEIDEGVLVNSIFEDAEQNIWLLSKRDGLVKINRSMISTIGKVEGLSGENILGLHQDTDGDFWVSARDFGLNKISGNTITQYREDGEIKSDIINSIAEDSSGNIWFGHFQKGLDKFDGETFTHFDIGEGLEENDVRTIYVSRENTIWVGTYDGLVKLDAENENHTIYREEDGLESSKIRYIASATDGSLWIGTLNGGISHFKEGEFINYTMEDGLSSNNIRSIYVDEKNPEILWIGTENNGLNRFKNGKFDYVSIADGLPDYNIHWISQDAENWLWILTNKGVVKINKIQLNDYLDGNRSSFQFIHYGRNEGMRNPEGNGSFQEAGLRLADGVFWFATQEGVSVFDTKETPDIFINPRVVIEKVKVENKEFFSDSISIGPFIDDFRVQYHAITFRYPEKTRFRYKLEGFQDVWVETNFQREVYLNNIPSGEYQFIVQATNENGIWSTYSDSVNISIVPAYYQQAWFYILLFLVIGGFTYLFSILWNRRLIRKQEQLEKIISEQTQRIRSEKREVEKQNKIIEDQAKELEKMVRTKDKFFSIIAHDLKNPFQILLVYTEQLKNKLDHANLDEIKEGFDMIRHSSKSLYSLTENLLQWANIQRGEVEPVKEDIFLHNVINKNRDIYVRMSEQKNLDLRFNLDSSLKVYADPDMIDTIIRNLVNNAIKFTPKNGTIKVGTKVESKWNVLYVTDSGVGMQKKMVTDVLKLDISSSRLGTENERGSGLGLILCKEMIEMHEGVLEIESEPGKGSTFIVKFPKVQ